MTAKGVRNGRKEEPAKEKTPAGNRKLQRWVDLIATLLNHKYAITFEQLADDVPEYSAGLRAIARATDDKQRRTMKESLKMMFERDKQELRDFGVPLISEGDDDGNEGGAYRIERKGFYLPYLSLVAPDGSRLSSPRAAKGFAYQALSKLALTPGELSAIVDAAGAVRTLGDAVLTADIDRALRKLAVDLPIDAFAEEAEPTTVLPRARPSNKVFESASEALDRRKRLQFDYHALSTDATERREVEPYGLFFLHGHWYLVARDVARGELRNFRLNRMSAPKVVSSTTRSADYDIPSTFRLREHAASRHAWELGDSDVMLVTVRVLERTGAAMAAANLGDAVKGDSHLREFRVRRADTFVRWLLSMAGGLVPVGPAEIVERYESDIAALRALYLHDAPEGPVSATVASKGDTLASEPWQPKTAAAQLQRILLLMPELADGEDHDLAEIAERVGSDVATVRRDLYSLSERYDVPGGFVEGVYIYIQADTVCARSEQLRRPMRLTTSELSALALGLSVLRGRRSPAEYADIERAREKLEETVAMLPGDELPASSHAVVSATDSGGERTVALLTTMKQGVRERRKVRLVYRKSGATRGDAREVCPLRFFDANGMLYVAAACGTDAGVQFFRFDRMESAELTDETFESPPNVDLSDVLGTGRVFRHDGAERMIVRYGKRIARWIAERERCEPDENGELVLEHPLADPEWGLRHVLQYGADAEILAPREMRELMRERLGRMGTAAG